MEAGALQKDVWHREAASVARRNGVQQRRWGMRVTVYNDPDPANNGDYVLSYNLASTNRKDNGNWLKVSSPGEVWGDGEFYTFSNGITETDGAVKLGGPLTANTTISGFAFALTINPKINATPIVSRAGINVGSLSGTPTNRINADLWYNSITNTLNAQINGQTVSLGDFWSISGDTTLTGSSVQIVTASANGLRFVDSTSTHEININDFELTLNSNGNSYNVTSAFFTGKHTFTPSVTLEGINVGSLAGDPTTPSNGGLWYNTTTNALNARINGVTVSLGSIDNAWKTSGTTTLSGALVNINGSGSNVIFEPKFSPQASSQRAGLNVGTVSASPSSISVGDIWYNTTDNMPYFYNGQIRQIILSTETQTLTNKTFGSGITFSVPPTINNNQKFTFNPGSTMAGINVGAEENDPTTLINGDMWYNTTTNTLNARINGVTVSLGGNGLQTASQGLTVVGTDVQFGGTMTGGTLRTITSTTGSGVAFNMGSGTGTKTSYLSVTPNFISLTAYSAVPTVSSSYTLQDPISSFKGPHQFIPNASGSAIAISIQEIGGVIQIAMPNLPTAATGLPTGTLWNDAGTLKISP